MPANIGISVSKDNEKQMLALPANYADAVREAGGVPWLLPTFAPGSVDEELVGLYVDRLDGLLLSGGPDLAPRYFGEEPHRDLGQVSPERDAIELLLARAALERDLPVLAICRGVQVLNVAAGGTLYQDVSSQVEGAIQHRQLAPRWHASHGVVVDNDSYVGRIFRTRESCLVVNSFHHQAVREPAPGFVITARSADDVVEAIEGTEHSFAIGVQWHPEMMVEHSPAMLAPFRALVAAAGRYHRRDDASC